MRPVTAAARSAGRAITPGRTGRRATLFSINMFAGRHPCYPTGSVGRI
jgi:hypothetical protein